MKKTFVVAAILAASVTPVFAASDGDHSARPRPEYRQLQQNLPILQVVRNPVDPTMRMYATTTTQYGRFGFSNLDERPSVEPLSIDSVERP